MHTATKRLQVCGSGLGHLVMHDVTARFPKRLAGNDLSGLLTFELKEDLAL